MHREFGEEKSLLLLSLRLGEEISRLKLGRQVMGDNGALKMISEEEGINTNMLGQLMLDRIGSNLYDAGVITVKHSWARRSDTKSDKKPDDHRSSVDHSSKLSFSTGTRYKCLFFGLPNNEGGTKVDTEVGDGSRSIGSLTQVASK